MEYIRKWHLKSKAMHCFLCPTNPVPPPPTNLGSQLVEQWCISSELSCESDQSTHLTAFSCQNFSQLPASLFHPFKPSRQFSSIIQHQSSVLPLFPLFPVFLFFLDLFLSQEDIKERTGNGRHFWMIAKHFIFQMLSRNFSKAKLSLLRTFKRWHVLFLKSSSSCRILLQVTKMETKTTPCYK